MFKCLFRLAFLAVIAIVGLYFVGAYQVLKTQEGIHLLKKKEWSLSGFFVNTSEWNLLDWAKHPEISKAMAHLELDKLRQYSKDAFHSFQKKLDAWRGDEDIDWTNEDLRKRWDEIKSNAKKGYDQLSRRLDEGDLSWEDFTKEAQRLEQRIEREVETLKKKWAEDDEQAQPASR